MVALSQMLQNQNARMVANPGLSDSFKLWSLGVQCAVYLAVFVWAGIEIFREWRRK
jgi:hypothetical protein